MSEWQKPEHANAYLRRADSIPQRDVGEATLLEELPKEVRRVLDLGSGNGRLLDLILNGHPKATGVALDFSPTMLTVLREKFAFVRGIEVIEHNLGERLPPMGNFDVVVSSFAIHHLEDERKRGLYAEIWRLLEPGGVFCNLDHVASESAAAHQRFLDAMGTKPGEEDPSNKLLNVRTQLTWLRAIGFIDVECLWKWRELALLVARKPA
jgi:SAM-dependent methyltransferase